MTTVYALLDCTTAWLVTLTLQVRPTQKRITL